MTSYIISTTLTCSTRHTNHSLATVPWQHIQQSHSQKCLTLLNLTQAVRNMENALDII